MSDFAGFPRQTVTFIRRLGENNHREWFQAHRDEYEQYWLEPAQDFVVAVAGPLRRLGTDVHAEPRVNGSIFRINRDIRFSKDKRPYKDHLDLWFWEGDRKTAVTGYFCRLTAETLVLGAGAHGFDPTQLERYRRAVVADGGGAVLRRAVTSVEKAGWQVAGERYKTVPRGFIAIDPFRERMLRYDGLWVAGEEPMSPVVHGPELVDLCLVRWKTAAPIHRWLVANLT